MLANTYQVVARTIDLPETAGKYEYRRRSSCEALRLRRVGVVNGLEAGV